MAVEKRFDFIDYAKTIGIFLICIGHFLPEGSLLKIIFYSFHVPIFFIISGFLFKREEFHFELYFEKQVNRILKPYIIYFIISALLYIFIEPKKLLQLPEMFLMLNGRTLWNDPLWFLPVIFFSNCLLGLLYQLLQKWGKKAFNSILFFVCCGMFFFTFLFDYFNIKSTPFAVNLLVHMFGYACIGVSIRTIYDKFSRFKNETKKIFSILCTIVFFFGCFMSASVNKANNISVYTADFNFLLFYIPFAILLSVSFLFLFLRMKPNSFIKLLSKNTIFIMCSHYFILLIYKNVFPFSSSFLVSFLAGCFTNFLYILFFAMANKKLIHNKWILNLYDFFQIAI